MIKKTYLIINYATIFVISIIVALIFLLSAPQTTQYLAEKLLKESGIEYSRIEGSLLSGVTLHDLKYADAVSAKRLQIEYRFAKLLRPIPKIALIRAEELSVTPENFPVPEGESPESGTFPFMLSQLQLEKMKIIIGDETFMVDANASKVQYTQDLDVERLVLELASTYGTATIEGSVTSNRLHAQSSLTPDISLSKQYLGFLSGLPKTLVFELDATLERALIHLDLNHAAVSADTNLSIDNSTINLSYLIEDNYFTMDASYALSYGEFKAQVKQRGLFTPSGVYTTELNATLTGQPTELPFKSFSAEVSGDTENIVASLHAGPLQFDLLGKGFERFVIHGGSDRLALSFIPGLPEMFKNKYITIETDAVVRSSPFSITGTLGSEGSFFMFEGSFELDKENSLYLATLHPKPEAEFWKAYPVERFSPLSFVLYESNQSSALNLDAQVANLTLFKRGAELTGWGSLNSGSFDAYGNIAENTDANITLSANIPSLNALLSELDLIDPQESVFFDAQADINATLTLTDKIRVESRVDLPWYSIKPDMKTHYTGKNLFVESTLMDNQLRLDRYSLDFMNHHIYSEKPSKLTLDANGTIKFKEFWIYDNLLLTGLINPLQMKGNLRIRSDRFRYESTEGNVTVQTDIGIDLDGNGTQKIEGSLTLLDGIITYAPPTDYTVSDEDIIIIQDIVPPGELAKRFINIQISSAKPIRYRVKDIDIRISPDFTLWQEPEGPLTLLGMASVPEGELTGSGKVFELDQSEIYFYGAYPINPYLNLHLHYKEIDNVDIEIFVTNTLDSPVLIFTSTPAMSQNDIMSYLLFGEPATSVFDSSGEQTSTAAVSTLLLGSGLKQIFKDTTGIKVDTLNILTNQEGTLGYEIGKRFSKEIRVLYRNDTTSSVILQYSLSKSIRIDVDVHETGQGVSILYVKDF